jgi:hypothetical protein
VSSLPRRKHDFATVSMDTWVNVAVISSLPREQIEPRVQRAFAWFEAGGDLALAGVNAAGEQWNVGIQHPRAEGLLARTLQLTNARCVPPGITSGAHRPALEPLLTAWMAGRSGPLRISRA